MCQPLRLFCVLFRRCLCSNRCDSVCSDSRRPITECCMESRLYLYCLSLVRLFACYLLVVCFFFVLVLFRGALVCIPVVSRFLVSREFSGARAFSSFVYAVSRRASACLRALFAACVAVASAATCAASAASAVAFWCSAFAAAMAADSAASSASTWYCCSVRCFSCVQASEFRHCPDDALLWSRDIQS